MRRYGFDILAMWEARTERRTEFVYMLTWPDETAKRAAWAQFMADGEWSEIKRVTSAQHGDLVGAIEDRVLVPMTTLRQYPGRRSSRRGSVLRRGAASTTAWPSIMPSTLADGRRTPRLTA